LSFVSENRFNENANVQTSQTYSNQKNYVTGFQIPLIATLGGKEGIYGVVSVPPGLLPVGWSITLSQLNETELRKPKPSKGVCDSNDKAVQQQEGLASVAFDMVIRDDQGREKSLQDLLKGVKKDSSASKGLGINLAYLLTPEQRKTLEDGKGELQYIYLDNGDKSWSFLDEKTTAKGGSFGNATTSVNHLTSKFGRQFSSSFFLFPYSFLFIKVSRYCL